MRKAVVFLLLPLLAIAAPATPASTAFAAEPLARVRDGADGKDKKKPAVHKITQSESYLMIDPFYASIMDDSHPLGLLMVGIGLDIPDAALRGRVDREMPRLRDAYVRCLMTFAATSVRVWRQPDVADMADRLQAVTDRYLARKGARVLLAQVMIRLNK